MSNDDRKERALNKSVKKTVLDVEKRYSNVNLVKHLPDDHILKKIALSIENFKCVAYPSSTAFLIIAGVLSGFTTRCHRVARFSGDEKGVPTNLYVASEQTSGSAKDLCIELVPNIFLDIYLDLLEKARKNEMELKNEKENFTKDSEDYKDAVDLYKSAQSFLEAISTYELVMSDATIEGAETSCCDTGGHFILASSEQELMSVLLGEVYGGQGGKKNKGLILKAFDGGYVSVKRAGNNRKTFKGIATGCIAAFAQDGLFRMLFNASESSGLRERFLLILEPNRGGERDFVNDNHFDWKLKDELKDCLQPLIDSIFSDDNIRDPIRFSNLPILMPTAAAFRLIDHFRNEMEATIGVNGIYSKYKDIMQGTVTKCDLQVLKMASVIYLSSRDFNMTWSLDIPDLYVKIAINLIRDILLSYNNLLENEQAAGDAADFSKITDYLSKQSKPKNRREVQQALRTSPPFKNYPSSYQKVGEAIEKMIAHDL